MKKRVAFILIGSLFTIGFILTISPTRAIIRDQTVSTVAEKDSYVNSYYPTSNYGGADWLIFGNYILGWTEAYLCFNFTDKPASWTKAEISIDMYSVSETFNVTVSLINDTWNEYTINWLNKPVHKEIITTFSVAEGKIYKFDITDYIEGRNNISIYLNASNYLQNGYVQGHSREGFYSWAPEGAPQLIWTYPETAEITVTSPKSSDVWRDINFYDIKWTSKGSIEKVIIQLYKGSTFIEDITYTYTESDGDYEFYVSSLENYKGTNYRIKITDYDDSRVYDYSDYFSINIGSGTITVTSPSSSSSWQPGTSHYIMWVSTGTIINVDIEIYKGNSLRYYLYDVSNTGSSFWLIDEDIELGTDWRIKISNADDSGQYDWSDYFEIFKSGDEEAIIPGYNLIFIFMTFGISIFLIKKLRFK